MTAKTLLRDGCVLTLSPKVPNRHRADVLIEGDRVVEIGTGLRARDAEVVEASDAIVMPGFVDTHRHCWRSLLRNLGDGPSTGGRGPAESLREHLRPDDVYAATLIGLLGAIEAGVTTVVDWSDPGGDDGVTEAALQAHADAGLRTVFVYGARRDDAGRDAGQDGAGAAARILARLAEEAGPSTTVALGSGGLGHPTAEPLGADWEAARAVGVRIHAHAGPDVSRPGVVSALAERALLRDDVTLVHCSRLDDADLSAIAGSGAALSLAPSSEMAAGSGSPPIQQLLDRDIRPGLGVDDERLAPGDLFAQMRATISVQHATVFDRKLAGKGGLPRLMTTRDVIRYATVDGARVAGLGAVTGCLEPGRRADVIVLRTDRPNIFPINDPIGAVVWGMDTSNVDWVFADGRVLMREGVLDADVRRARDLAMTARERLASAAGLVVSAGSGAEG